MSGSGKRAETIVGIFLLTGLLLLGGLILQFARFKERFGGFYQITVVFDDASGVIKGSEVRMGGARIGRVAALPELNDEVRVEVPIAVDKNIRIPAGSSFQINSATLLGDKLIVVIPPVPQTGTFIEPDSRLRGAGPTGLDALQNHAETAGRDVVRILKEAETTLAKVDAAVVGIHDASRQLGDALGKINSSLLSEGNLNHLGQTIANLSETTEGWKRSGAKLDPAIDEARAAIASVRSAAALAEKTLAAVQPALRKLPSTVDSIHSTSNLAGLAFERINRGEGMLGAFASDNAVALDFKTFMNNLRRHGVMLYRDDSHAVPARELRIKGRPP